ncbi:MAG: CPBP family intramembrane metalloprotease [Spirochaetaceae bacterium]|nr:CPBP family intramembrane metalloprotease [Spirochaetaceae bacterium]
MFHYFMTLGIYSIVLFLALFFISLKEISKNMGAIINIIIWYTLLNFADVFPWFSFGHMNWTGKLLVMIIVGIVIIYKKLKKENGFVFFVFEKENRKTIIITITAQVLITLTVLILLLVNGKFDIERFIMNVVLVGISEELYFRGLLYNKISKIQIKNKRPEFIHVLICSFAFGILHMYFFNLTPVQNIINFLIPFVFGIFFNIMYNKSKNILVPILIHNSIDTLYYGILTFTQIYFIKLGGG